MEQTGFSNGLPEIRQKPGGSNALGRVKFLFPNSFNIYFHDTPAKSLFKREKRAFSHGCIRLAEPKKMAQYLLRNQTEWTEEKIDEAMSLGKEKWVT
jgi:murein L,D-transpeptidase YcbB/YkuD